MRISLVVALISLLSASIVHAEMKTKRIQYQVGSTKFESILVYEADLNHQRPGLIMFPNWYGMNNAQIEKAKAIAGKDYVVLVADVYGKKIRPKNNDEASTAASAMYKDRDVWRARANAALAQLIAQSGSAPLDVKHIGAIGFCFGGASALELARSGADISAVVSFHGNLSTDNAKLAKQIKASVLVINGADDTYVPPKQIEDFSKEMRDAVVDWQFVNMGGAVHCFAEPDANQPPGCLYNERAAKRSFTMMRNFFTEAFQ